MSGGKKTSTTQTTVTKPDVPQWVDQGQQVISGQVQNYLGQDPSKFVAGASDLQNQAFEQVRGLDADPNGYLGSAYNLTLGGGTGRTQVGDTTHATATHAQSQSLLDGLTNYMNPYTDAVVNSGLQDIDRSRQMMLLQNGDQAQASRAFGGDRHAVLESLTNDDALRQASSFANTTRSQGFDTAASLSGQDADRRQQVSLFNAGADNTNSMFNAGADNSRTLAQAGYDESGYGRQLQAGQTTGQIGGQYANNQQTNLGLLGDLGGVQQQLNQAQAGAPLSVLSQLGAVNSGIPYGLFSGSTQTGNGTSTSSGSWLDKIGQGIGIASSAASLFSDAGLKRDIETEHYDAKGRRWTTYNYLWDGPDEPKRLGVIAQEVRETDPDAVMVHPSGFLMVDYAKLED